jgi:hypothetical protein
VTIFDDRDVEDLINRVNSPRPAIEQEQEQEREQAKVTDIGNGNSKANGKGKKPKRKSQQQEEKEEPPKKELFLERYAVDGSIAEAVIMAGVPKFAVAVPKAADPTEVSITLQDEIEPEGQDSIVIKPLDSMSHMSKAYRFTSVEGFQDLVKNIRTKDLDALYRTVKSVWKKYIDADDFHLSLCAADTVFTYFQDKIGLTHYLFFIGGNTSGKSNNLTVLHYLAYRNMMDSGMTAPNVYTFLGSREEGIGSICEDEADNIDQDSEKMKVYKNGYTTGKPYHRIDTSFGGRKQGSFNTFCFKAFAAEKLPDSVTAKGFNTRVIELPCLYGFPDYDILDVENAAGDETYEQLLGELHTVRNSLLVYRLLHFHGKIPELKLNIQNREKQLFKPVLKAFQSTQTFNELLPVISKYVNQKRQSNANTLHASLYRLINDLIKAQDTYSLESGLIWNIVKETLQGKDIPYKPQSYDTVEFGAISQKGIIETLQQVFAAKSGKRHPGIKTLTFDKDKLQRLGKIYELTTDISVKVGVEDVEHVEDIGLDKHLTEQSSDKKTEDIDQENQNLSDKTSQSVENISTAENDKAADSSLHPPQAPQAPPKQNQHDAYFELGKWHCKDCKATGDKFHMENTPCNGGAKK